MKLREKIMTADPDGGLYIPPDELLKEAGIDPNADLDIVLQEQKITILSAVKPEDVVPVEILEACAELGISQEKVSTILRTEGDLSGLGTDI